MIANTNSQHYDYNYYHTSLFVSSPHQLQQCTLLAVQQRPCVLFIVALGLKCIVYIINMSWSHMFHVKTLNCAFTLHLSMHDCMHNWMNIVFSETHTYWLWIMKHIKHVLLGHLWGPDMSHICPGYIPDMLRLCSSHNGFMAHLSFCVLRLWHVIYTHIHIHIHIHIHMHLDINMQIFMHMQMHLHTLQL